MAEDGEGLSMLEEILERSGDEVPEEILDLDAFLKQSPLFAVLDEEARRELASKARYHWCNAGDVLMKEGSGGDTFAVIKRGELSVDAAFEGKRKHLATLGPGAVVGEVAVLKATERTATVTCETDVELFEFSRDDARPFLAAHPELREELERLIESRSEAAIEIFLGEG